MPSAIEAHEHPLHKIFSSEFEFVIPDYQRPYRWGRDQVGQLLDDFEETLDRADGDPYFMGSLVLVEVGPHFDVIDGQQRLTTLTILLAVLRDLESDEEVAANLAACVLEPGNKLRGIAPSTRLRLRDDKDDKFFGTYVQARGAVETLVGLSDAAATTEPQRAIRDNATLLRDRLLTWSDERRTELATLIINRTYLVVVSTADLDSAYRIFSVMNARGLDLSPPDIFKSTVIGGAGSDQARSEYAEKWEHAEEALGSAEFLELFRDIRTVESGERARRELLEEFPKQVLSHYRGDGREARFVDDLLLPYAKAFERTIERDLGPGSEWEPVNHWLRRLDLIDNRDWRPCALWALVNHADDAEFLTVFLKRLERLAASFLLRQAYTSPRVARYLELLRQLKSGQGLKSDAFELSDEERVLTVDALRGEIYRMNTRRARYVLLRLDELLAKGPGATYDHKIISIEHVLPQNPRDDSQWLSDFTDEQRAQLTHRLGNLLLLNHRKNSQANNYDFDTKKQRYFTISDGSAVFALTTQVVGESSWTPEVIERRQAALIDLLANEWDLN